MKQLYPNARVPAVDPADVEAVWRFLNQVSPSVSGPFEEAGSDESGTPAVGFCTSLVAGHCSPGADVEAVSVRTMLVSVVFQMGLLTPWLQDGELDRRVFRVAATMPIDSLDRFSPEAFVAGLPGASDLQ